jgi:hypothetical protein
MNKFDVAHVSRGDAVVQRVLAAGLFAVALLLVCLGVAFYG